MSSATPMPQPAQTLVPPRPEFPRGYVVYQNSCIECHALAHDPYDRGERLFRMYLDTRHSSDEELNRRLDDRASSPVTDQDRKDFLSFLRSLEK